MMNQIPAVISTELQPVKHEWLPGFHSIYQKELFGWFGTSRWVTQLIIWLGLGALSPIAMIVANPDAGKDRGVAVLTLFLWSGSNMMSIGTIILSQGTIVEEKVTKTLLWIFSKPLSAAGFIMGKFAAYAVLIGLLVLGLPAVIAYIAAIFIGISSQISVLNYLAGVVILYLVLLFVLALTILMGVLVDRTAAVTTLALLIFLSGTSIQSTSWLSWLEPYTVWALQHNAGEVLVGKFPTMLGAAIGNTIAMIIGMLLIAIWRMKKYDF
jgi:ABC-2 type transport system permease protein